MASYFQNASKKGKNAFNKMHLSFLAYYEFYKNNPEIFRLMNYIGYIKKKNTPQRKEWLKFDDELFKGIALIIDEGIKDGSIRKDIDKNMTTYILAFLSTGFFRQLSENGETFTDHFNLNIDNFVKQSLNFILKSIKN